MFKFITKSIFFFFCLLLMMPALVAGISIFKSSAMYMSSNIVEGIVVDCIGHRQNVTYNNQRYTISYKKIIKLPENITTKGKFTGNKGYPTKSICEDYIGNKEKVLIDNKGNANIYSLLEFFMFPIVWTSVTIFLYSLIFLIIKKFKRKSSNLKNEIK